MKQKRILTIQDLSCVGKCSLTVALPIISSYGIETCILPSAILSNHTAFNNYSFFNMNNEIDNIISNFIKNKFVFNMIYTGYIGSTYIIDKIIEYKDKLLSNDGKLIVDPAFGDNGNIYKGFDINYINKIKELCMKADIILPNLTEACFLTDTVYNNNYDEEYLSNIIKSLNICNMNCIVLKGISINNNYGVMLSDYNRKDYYFHKYLSKSYHGTGDIFASVFVSKYLLTDNLYESMKEASDFTVDTIKETINDDIEYGTNFETVIYKKMVK